MRYSLRFIAERFCTKSDAFQTQCLQSKSEVHHFYRVAVAARATILAQHRERRERNSARAAFLFLFPGETMQSTGIIKALRSAKMPTTTRKTAPSKKAMTECAKTVRDLVEAADWFDVSLETLTAWLREKPELARAFRRAKLNDVREMRLIFREKAVAGSIMAVNRHLQF